MATVSHYWRSTVGRKFIMAISGIALILYLIVHLAGNLMLFIPDGGQTYNRYSYFLHQMGPVLTVFRVLLAAAFLFHIATAIRVYAENRRGRSTRYAVYASKGGPSKLSASSRYMASTGLILLIFVPIHVWMFTLAPHGDAVVGGVVVRDVYGTVVPAFKNPWIAFGYSATMALLWMHLRHGFWSALQSLGALKPRLTHAIYAFGLTFSILLAGGFLILPLYVFFFVPYP